MKWFNLLMARLRALLRREAVIEDIDEELRSHIEMETEANIGRGMEPEEARRVALKSFGNVGSVRDRAYEVRGGGLLETLWQDLRYGARMLIKRPGFTFVAVLTLALGIGANTAIFSVVNAVLLRSLPYPQPDRLVRCHWQFERDEEEAVSNLVFEFWKEHTRSFESVAGFAGTNSGYNLSGGAEPQRVRGLRVSEGFFRTLGVGPAIGRGFTPEEDRPGPRVVVISDGLWRSYFGSDPSLIGREVTLNGNQHTVIGIMPAGFQFELPADVLVPLRARPDPNDDSQNTGMIARLRSGVTLEQAQAEVSGLVLTFRVAYPNHLEPGGSGLRLVSYQEFWVKDISHVLWLLFGAVGFVLLIACANVANLLLARARARRGEIAVRLALGATRARLIRQLLTESWMLAALGSLAGLLLALLSVPALLALAPSELPRLGEVGLDLPAVLFTIGVSFLSSLLFGLAPALRATRLDVNEAIKGVAGKGSSGKRDSRARDALMAGEIALSLVLLVGAGLMIKSFVKLRAVDLGFEPQQLTTMQVSLASARYLKNADTWAFEQRVLERVSAQSGVAAAAFASSLPLERGLRIGITANGRASDRSVQVRAVSPQYFRALGIFLARGRAIAETDNALSAPVAVINEALARQFWPDGDPIGRQLSLQGRPREIVGVVSDIREIGLDQPVEPTIYLSMPQVPDGLTAAMNNWFLTSLIVRTSGPVDLTTAIREAVREADPQLPLANIRPMTQVISASVSSRRFILTLMVAFAAVAFALVAVGIYGVLSYQVAQRTHEIGIRIALGAGTTDIFKLVVGQGMQLALTGVAVGFVGALALTRVLKSLLFGVSATDPLTYVGVALLLTVVALLASYIPARRATKVDPLIALRYE